MLSDERIRAIAEKFFPPPAQPSAAVEALVLQEQDWAVLAIHEAIKELIAPKPPPTPCGLCGHEKHLEQFADQVNTDCRFNGCACPC